MTCLRSWPSAAGCFARMGMVISCLARRSGAANFAGTRPARAGLDLERDVLAADQAVEVDGCVERVTVEEVVLPVLAGDEAESAVGHDLLDPSRCHGNPRSSSRTRISTHGSVREEPSTSRELPRRREADSLPHPDGRFRQQALA